MISEFTVLIQYFEVKTGTMGGNQKSGAKCLHRFYKRPSFIVHLGASNEIEENTISLGKIELNKSNR